jgi:hypothetical protein
MILGNWHIHMKKTETRLLFLNLYKNQFKMDLKSYIIPETLKLLVENLGETLNVYVGKGNNFLNRSPIVQKIRIRVDKW